MVEDENDNSPSFDRHIYQGSIQENSPPGTEVILGSVLKVQDPDINDIVRLRVRKILFQKNFFSSNNINIQYRSV